MLSITDAREKAEYAKTHRVAYAEECKQNKTTIEHQARLSRLFLLYNQALVQHFETEILSTFETCIAYVPASYESVVEEFAASIRKNGHGVRWLEDSDEFEQCLECSHLFRGYPVVIYTI
jgi:hypothetical protein